MREIRLGPVTFCVDNDLAADILQGAVVAYKLEDMDAMRELRTSAARVEDGIVSEYEGLVQAEPHAKYIAAFDYLMEQYKA